MKEQNFYKVEIPKGSRENYKMLAKVYGRVMTFDFNNPKVEATCTVYLIWGIN